MKNHPLTAENFSYGSGREVWWLCKKGHSYPRRICDRTRKLGCPQCASKRARLDYNLLVNFPEIASQWHFAKNGELGPESVTRYSNKKVWWQCVNQHEWQAVIQYRVYKQPKCPHCANAKFFNLDLFD